MSSTRTSGGKGPSARNAAAADISAAGQASVVLSGPPACGHGRVEPRLAGQGNKETGVAGWNPGPTSGAARSSLSLYGDGCGGGAVVSKLEGTTHAMPRAAFLHSSVRSSMLPFEGMGKPFSLIYTTQRNPHYTHTNTFTTGVRRHCPLAANQAPLLPTLISAHHHPRSSFPNFSSATTRLTNVPT